MTKSKKSADIFLICTPENAQKLIGELENLSPIYCDFYKNDNKKLVIDKNKLSAYINQLNACITMIKSGRAENIKMLLTKFKKTILQDKMKIC